MNPTSCPPDKVFLTAARCADCPNPACVQACPEHVDLQALFEFVVANAPPSVTRMLKAEQAETYAGEAIHNSFD